MRAVIGPDWSLQESAVHESNFSFDRAIEGIELSNWLKCLQIIPKLARSHASTSSRIYETQMIGVRNSYHDICHVTNFEDIGIVARAVNRKLTTGLDVETYQIIIASYQCCFSFSIDIQRSDIFSIQVENGSLFEKESIHIFCDSFCDALPALDVIVQTQSQDSKSIGPRSALYNLENHSAVHNFSVLKLSISMLYESDTSIVVSHQQVLRSDHQAVGSFTKSETFAFRGPSIMISNAAMFLLGHSICISSRSNNYIFRQRCDLLDFRVCVGIDKIDGRVKFDLRGQIRTVINIDCLTSVVPLDIIVDLLELILQICIYRSILCFKMLQHLFLDLLFLLLGFAFLCQLLIFFQSQFGHALASDDLLSHPSSAQLGGPFDFVHPVFQLQILFDHLYELIPWFGGFNCADDRFSSSHQRCRLIVD